MQYVMPVEVLVTLNVGTVKLKRKHLHLFGPARDLICRYLYGLPEFDLVTDHQALNIYGPTSKPSARIERWVLRLQPFNYRVRYVTSRENIADALSRLTKIPVSKGFVQDEEYVHKVTQQAVPVALRIGD